MYEVGNTWNKHITHPRTHNMLSVIPLGDQRGLHTLSRVNTKANQTSKNHWIMSVCGHGLSSIHEVSVTNIVLADPFWQTWLAMSLRILSNKSELDVVCMGRFWSPLNVPLEASSPRFSASNIETTTMRAGTRQHTTQPYHVLVLKTRLVLQSDPTAEREREVGRGERER